jgi:hypothetical protein
MTLERHAQAQTLLTFGGREALLWRNDTGAAVPCRLEELKAAKRDPRVLDQLIARGMVRYGLCKGSSDLIGLVRGGRFVAIEFKSDRGRPTAEQLRFIELVQAFGGLAGVSRSVGDSRRILGL